MQWLRYLLALMATSFLAQTIQAQDFIYTPKNPAFGGNTFNHQWMLSAANAQNTYEDPNQTEFDRFERDPLQDFQQSLQRQILNQLSRSLVDTEFGQDGLGEGTYNVGGYQIDITEGLEGVSVQILDTATGDQTSVFVPYVGG